MTIKVGDPIPDVKLMTMTGEGPKPAQSGEVLGSGKVVLFAVPGAFTPTCSDYDAFVMGAWGNAQNVDDKVTLLADGNGDFTSAMGLEMDGSGFGLGTRSQRYAAIVEDGVVKELLVEPGPGLEVSSADAVLAKL
jgi:peroxiredoxin